MTALTDGREKSWTYEDCKSLTDSPLVHGPSARRQMPPLGLETDRNGVKADISTAIVFTDPLGAKECRSLLHRRSYWCSGVRPTHNLLKMKVPVCAICIDQNSRVLRITTTASFFAALNRHAVSLGQPELARLGMPLPGWYCLYVPLFS